MSDQTETADVPKKKGKMKKLLVIAGGLIVLVGGGVGAGLYASQSGLIGGGNPAAAEGVDTPKLVPKSEEKRAGAGAEGAEAAEGEAKASHEGLPTPKGAGGDKYASNYFTMEKEFTSNLKESTHFIQVGIAVSTPYDERVIENLKTHEIAVRSAVLLALGETDEELVFTSEGKAMLQKRLAGSINGVLKQKEGFGGISNVYFTNFVVQ
jgi:flagellar FliL protein